MAWVQDGAAITPGADCRWGGGWSPADLLLVDLGRGAGSLVCADRRRRTAPASRVTATDPHVMVGGEWRYPRRATHVSTKIDVIAVGGEFNVHYTASA
ncbi:MAG: hypothetical protein R2856_08390 [Caldilineaceae bacterium]